VDTNTPDPDSQEPVLSVGAVTAGVSALIALLVAFGVDLTEAQTTAILGLVAVAAPFVVGVLARRRAYAPATVARLLRSNR
jgi:hypothetical protein